MMEIQIPVGAQVHISPAFVRDGAYRCTVTVGDVATTLAMKPYSPAPLPGIYRPVSGCRLQLTNPVRDQWIWDGVWERVS